MEVTVRYEEGSDPELKLVLKLTLPQQWGAESPVRVLERFVEAYNAHRPTNPLLASDHHLACLTASGTGSPRGWVVLARQDRIGAVLGHNGDVFMRSGPMPEGTSRFEPAKSVPQACPRAAEQPVLSACPPPSSAGVTAAGPGNYFNIGMAGMDQDQPCAQMETPPRSNSLTRYRVFYQKADFVLYGLLNIVDRGRTPPFSVRGLGETHAEVFVVEAPSLKSLFRLMQAENWHKWCDGVQGSPLPAPGSPPAAARSVAQRGWSRAKRDLRAQGVVHASMSTGDVAIAEGTTKYMVRCGQGWRVLPVRGRKLEPRALPDEGELSFVPPRVEVVHVVDEEAVM